VAHTFHATVNDVVLAAVTAAYRRLLIGRGEEPQPHSVRTLVPVSVRTADQDGSYDNRISLMLAFLPVDVSHPVERLRTVSHRLRMLKASKEAEAGEAFTDLAIHEPFPPISLGVRLASHLPQRSIVTVTTNVPGPRRPLYLLGRPMLELFPYVPIAVRLRTGVSVLTYCDQVAFGVTADFTQSDAQLLVNAIEQGIAELVHAAAAARR
jgi:diacylglycerol O-acyltransferase / wax synthase